LEGPDDAIDLRIEDRGQMSVMITEFISKPQPLALSLSILTITRLGCPERAMLLVIIATIL